MNQYYFLNIYKKLLNNRAEESDVAAVYWDLHSKLSDSSYSHLFKSEPLEDDMVVAIDYIAHQCSTDVNLLKSVYSNAVDEFVESLSLLIKGRKPLLEDISGGFIFLEKEQVGRTTKEDIVDSIKEYERLYKAGLSSPAELLTLARYYDSSSIYATEALRKGLDTEENEPLVVGGPASVVGVDQEGHLITAEALKKAFAAFMSNFRTRNVMIFHSDVQCGWALPAYITKTGSIFKSGVDNTGLWLISEVSDSTPIGKKVAQEIKDGKIRSYSIAGSATKTEYITKGLQQIMQVNELVL